MKRILTLLASLGLVAGLFVGTPSPVAAQAPNTWTVADSTARGTGAPSTDCAHPSFATRDASTGFTSDDEAVRAAVNDATTGDTIFLCSTSTYLFQSEVDATDGLIFQGANSTSGLLPATVIDGGGDTRLLAANGNITINNLRVINGYSGDVEGGAVLAEGNLSVNSSYFKDNFSLKGGGAIAAGGLIAINRSTFLDNSTTDRGGAVAGYGQVEAHDSLFQGNVSIADENCVGAGGAIAAGDDVWAYSSKFIGNRADLTSGVASECGVNDTGGDGGAIATVGYAFVYDSSFVSNEASRAGGSIYSYFSIAPTEASGIIERSTFTGGSAVDGGAIAQYQSDLVVSGSTFSANDADQGGAIFVGSGTLTVQSSGRRVSTFLANSAGSRGGAIATFGRSSVNVIGGQFTRNQANDEGGAISTAFLTTTNANFSENNA